MNSLSNSLPLVSMISVFYNRAYCVKESVQSMLDQNYPNLEIILVDDCSTDNTLDELNEFSNDSRVKIITHENFGFTRSIKHAIERVSKGKYIAIHGSGDVSYPMRITRQVEYLISNPDVGAVACGREIYSEKTHQTKINNFPVDIKEKGLIKYGINPFSQGEVTFNRSVYGLSGGYREIFKYAQDYDLWLRMNERSRLVRLPEVLYKEFGRLDGVRNNLSKVIEQKKYAQLGILSAESREVGPDIVDSIIGCPFDLLIGVGRVSKRFVKLSFIELVRGDFKAARTLYNEAIKYKITWRTIFLNILIGSKYLRNSLMFLGGYATKYRAYIK